MLANIGGDGLDRHGFDEGHDHGLEQQGEAASWSSPRNRQEFDSTLVASNTRNFCRKVGLMLEKVQMAPCLLNGVVSLEAHLATFRASEHAAARTAKPDVEALSLRIELARNHLPRRGQAKGQLEKVGVFHRRTNYPDAVRGSRLLPT
jgi:hypothetical protein